MRRTLVVTAYTCSSAAFCVDGYEAMSRRVIRRDTDQDERAFLAELSDDLGASRDVDMLCEFGPVGQAWSEQR